MSAFFVYHRTTGPTGRLLARTLGVSRGYVSRANRLVRDGDVVIRWGVSEGRFHAAHVINEPEAIHNAVHKLRALQLLREAGVPVPNFATHFSSLAGVVLGRNSSGYGGRDIVVYDGSSPIGEHHAWYSQYIENDREYRIHVYRGEVIRVQRKYLEVPEDRTSEYIKNYANGYRFKAPRRELNRSRKEAAINAVRGLGLTFGAVDLIVDHDGREYVLEVNTAPKCSPRTARAYIEQFAAHLGELGVECEPNYELLEGSEDGS